MTNSFARNQIIKLDTVDSTNKYAQGLLKKEKIDEGTVIVAGVQLEGKGQGGNLWESGANKNLTMSIILRPVFLLPEKQFQLNKIIALAVYDFVKNILKEQFVKIKWPNDIYFENRKIAGILIENSILGNSFDNSVVGIGVNVNQIDFKSDAPNPVSLRNITGENYNLDDCLTDLIACIEHRYLLLKSKQDNVINSDYLNALYKFQSYSKFKSKIKIFEAKITGVSEFGKLILENRENEKFEFNFKEVEFI